MSATYTFDSGYTLQELLGRTGAQPGRYAKKWNCPRCGRPGHLSVQLAKGFFKCWTPGCDFQGNAGTLGRQLGLLQKLPPHEAKELRARRENGKAWGRTAYEAVRARRFELYEEHRSLLRIVAGASGRLKENICDEVAWAGIAFAYRQLDAARAELLLLEAGPVAEIAAFMGLANDERQSRIMAIIRGGGLLSRNGKFIELDVLCPAFAPQNQSCAYLHEGLEEPTCHANLTSNGS